MDLKRPSGSQLIFPILGGGDGGDEWVWPMSRIGQGKSYDWVMPANNVEMERDHRW